MTALPPDLQTLIESGPLAHLTTINEDGSPQVTCIWIGLDGEDVVSGHMSHKRLVQNIERDPRVVLSFSAPKEPGAFLVPYAVLRAKAGITGPTEEAWELLDRLAKIYVAPDADFPAPRGPGYLTRYTVERIAGVGPWVSTKHWSDS
jgi:PPOX class probable F420-dependent enzyme